VELPSELDKGPDDIAVDLSSNSFSEARHILQRPNETDSHQV